MGAAQADFRQSSSRIDRTQSKFLSSKNKLKLAVFGINVSNGCTMTPAGGTIQVAWAESKRIAQAAEKLVSKLCRPCRMSAWMGSPCVGLITTRARPRLKNRFYC